MIQSLESISNPDWPVVLDINHSRDLADAAIVATVSLPLHLSHRLLVKSRTSRTAGQQPVLIRPFGATWKEIRGRRCTSNISACLAATGDSSTPLKEHPPSLARIPQSPPISGIVSDLYVYVHVSLASVGCEGGCGGCCLAVRSDNVKIGRRWPSQSRVIAPAVVMTKNDTTHVNFSWCLVAQTPPPQPKFLTKN
jgi:hypothetical protein